MSNDRRRTGTKRRSYLRAVGTGLLALTAGCGGRQPEPTTVGPTTTETTTIPGTTTRTTFERIASRYERVVDLERAGADTTGRTPVNSIIEDAMADDTLFYFPAGRYRIAGLLVLQHRSNVGILGPEATLLPRDRQQGSWIVVDDVADFLFAGPTVDNRAKNTGVRLDVSVSGGTNLVRDVTMIGFHDVDSRTHGFTLQVNGADTELTLRNVTMRDGAANGTGIFVHPADAPGTLRLENVSLENWYEQGLYGSPHGGPMYVVGGEYVNNGKAQVRVGGGNADTPAVVRDVTVRVNDPNPQGIKGNTRGIWLKEGENSLVENCSVELSNLGKFGSAGAVVIGKENGRSTIRNTSIRVDDSTFAISAFRPTNDYSDTPSLTHPLSNWDLTIEDVEITGTAPSGTAVWLVGRSGSVLRNVSIDQHGAGRTRNGVSIVDSPGTLVDGLSCTTPNYPLVFESMRGGAGCDVTLRSIDDLVSTTHHGSKRVGGSDGTYCLRHGSIGTTDATPVVGVTGVDSRGVRVTLLPPDAIDPF